MGTSYEALAFSVHMPNHCIAFTYGDDAPPFAGGVFRIERVRTATAADEKAFRTRVHNDVCPLCNQREQSA